jgi:hypothetical protein
VDGTIEAVIAGRRDVMVHGIAYQSAGVKPGDLFVGLRGSREAP